MSSAISPSWNRDPHRSLGGHNVRSNADELITIKSPLLFDMLKKLSITERRSVLDMGCSSQSSLEFFSDYWCKLFIVDAIRELYELNSLEDDAPEIIEQRLVSSIQFYNQPTPDLDMILLWSLPNYLTPKHLKQLIAYLLRHASRRIQLHTYIYNTERMPAVPARYQIRQDNRVTIVPASDKQKNCPLYHLAELHNCFSPLKVDHSVMLSSGIQEYVFSA